MSQIEGGVRSLLARPSLYRSFQYLVGSATVTEELVRQSDVRAGDTILDIGCGTATILDHLPTCQYVGFDVSADYIQSARQQYGDRATFYSDPVDGMDRNELLRHGPFDVVFAQGVLHHLSDIDAGDVFVLAAAALRPGGRFVSVDPVLEPGQPRLARMLVKRDRGTNVRSVGGYMALAADVFEGVQHTVRHDMLRIPYSHMFIRCQAC